MALYKAANNGLPVDNVQSELGIDWTNPWIARHGIPGSCKFPGCHQILLQLFPVSGGFTFGQVPLTLK